MKSISQIEITLSVFDSVVILSCSNWFKELRSNRYHYATRFARHYPVIFVQPDLHYKGYQFEATEFEAVKVLHVWKRYDTKQIELLYQALLEAGANKPIFWIYNGQFNQFIASRDSVLNVYHATEDYFSSDSYIPTPPNQLKALNHLLAQCQLLVCVSEGVAESYQQQSAFCGKSITITNGCDYQFYAPQSIEQFLKAKSQQPIAFYQGNIFDKMDYELLIQLASRMPIWQFQFCGRVLFNEKSWQKLCCMPNVQYLGVLTPEEIREYSYQATVGLIPFVESEFLIRRSLPLKAFEYLACGLPVVSIPIMALQPFNHVMQLASGAEAFEREMIRAQALRDDNTHLALRLEVASQQDYDGKFETVLAMINELSKNTSHIAQTSPKCIGPHYSEKRNWISFNRSGLIRLLFLVSDRIPATLKEKIPASIKRMLMTGL